MGNENRKCDVCINIFGKYYQTLVSLKTLLLYNKQFIDKIYLIREKKQPESFNINCLIKELGHDNIEVYTPKHFFGLKTRYSIKGFRIRKQKKFTYDFDFEKIKYNQRYRHSLRYQYPLEISNSKYMFIMHNDVVFHKNFLDSMMEEIDNGNIGVGSIGQCWNCPLSFAGVCDGNIIQTLNLSYEQICSYVTQFKSPRTTVSLINKDIPLPMPECRLNEWVSMINCYEYRKITIPFGTLPPLGVMGLDIGTDFYREAILIGKLFKNVNIKEYATHSFFSEGRGGNRALFNKDLYLNEEEAAKAYLLNLTN